MTFRSALYRGVVVHSRFRPKVHRLRYRLFWMLLDLDELDRIAGLIPFFSRNRFNVFSFHEIDHGGGQDEPLRARIEKELSAAGVRDVARIELLCMPRIFGYQFNPLSVYFCRRADDQYAAIIYEVHNTFGERHSYLFKVDGAGPFEHDCAKDFYVSPFLGMDMQYSFHVIPAGETVSVRIQGDDRDGPSIVASLAGNRTTLTARALLATLVTYPLVTLKVIAAIHWNALLMLVKGFRLQPRPQQRDPGIKIAREVQS